jgi:chromosome segregation ATPase
MTSQRDRIESLESRVEELEATIRGLTEELVDANQRLRELETDQESTQAEEAKTDESKEEIEEDEGGSDPSDDIIVA